MTAAEIRAMVPRYPSVDYDVYGLLREIAAQMAEQNEHLKKISERV